MKTFIILDLFFLYESHFKIGYFSFMSRLGQFLVKYKTLRQNDAVTYLAF